MTAPQTEDSSSLQFSQGRTEDTSIRGEGGGDTSPSTTAKNRKNNRTDEKSAAGIAITDVKKIASPSEKSADGKEERKKSEIEVAMVPSMNIEEKKVDREEAEEVREEQHREKKQKAKKEEKDECDNDGRTTLVLTFTKEEIERDTTKRTFEFEDEKKKGDASSELFREKEYEKCDDGGGGSSNSNNINNININSINNNINNNQRHDDSTSRKMQKHSSEEEDNTDEIHVSCCSSLSLLSFLEETDRKGRNDQSPLQREISVSSFTKNAEDLRCSVEDATVIEKQTPPHRIAACSVPFSSPKRLYITCNTFDDHETHEHENFGSSNVPSSLIDRSSFLDNGNKKNHAESDHPCDDHHRHNRRRQDEQLDFHEAVRIGDVQSVEELLAGGYVQNLDEPDWNVSGDAPLLVAATNHCLPVLSTLLAHGCDPAVRSPRGETALHRAILSGGPANVLNFVVELLKYGCPPAVKEAGGGLTALHILTRQLAHAQNLKNLHHDFDFALKTLDLLAKTGPVNAKDHQGRTALHILASSTAFDSNHTAEIESLIETLLAAGANPAAKNDRGETALHECLECGALNTASLLIPHTPTGIMSRYGETPLHVASRKNYVKMVSMLLERGEDPSVQDAGGNTPLHLASARGFHQTISLLITSPLAQLEKTNADGLTALQIAAESGFVNAVRLLLKAGADPSQTIHYCATTLQRHPDISLLIDHELMRRRQLAA